MTYGFRDSFLYGSYKRLRSAFRSGGGGFGRAGSYISFDIKFGGLTLFEERLDYELNSPNGMVGSHMNKMARIITERARSQAGAKTGKLRASIRWEYSKTPVGQDRLIYSKLPYALAHHEGTKPHVIVPKKAEVLSFKNKGVIVHTDQVNHPGVRPNRYLTDNLYVVVSSYLRMLPRV
jgi:hypothetical protein